MEGSIFERMGGTYRQEGDYFLPNLTVPESVPIGIWGQRRRQYLREHREALYNAMLLSGKLDSHLADINQQADNMFFQLVDQMATQEGITEQLKAENQVKWIGQMNNIKGKIEEKKIDRISTQKRSLRALIKEMEDEVLASAGVDSFEEIFKLIFAKLYDELICANDSTAHLKFRNSGDTDFELKQKIQGLFDDAKRKWEGIFADESKILLSPSHLALCVSTLQDIKLFNDLAKVWLLSYQERTIRP